MMKRLSSSVQIQRPEVTSEFAYSSPEIPVEQYLASDSVSWLFHAVAALFGLFFFSPLFLLIALAVKLTDSGPIFYRGRRVGRDGHIFWIYKFRTLRDGAEKEIGARLLNDDDRAQYCTKIGKFLKRSKLDELPQLVNVLRGEMRLAGPRPVRPIFLRQFEQEIPNYAARFRVPPGITGIAQLRGGYYTSPRNKLRYDLIYIRNRSLLLDVKLVLLTFIKILDRWLTLGFFLCFLFLFVSFVPPSVQSFWSPSWGGGNWACPSCYYPYYWVEYAPERVDPLFSVSRSPEYADAVICSLGGALCPFCGRTRCGVVPDWSLRDHRFLSLVFHYQ